MSKYNYVWEYVKKDGRDSFKLTFEDIKKILGFEIDHSFLNSKKELRDFGYEVGKISLKDRTIIFNRIK